VGGLVKHPAHALVSGLGELPTQTPFTPSA
jgi:hypothetical protein